MQGLEKTFDAAVDQARYRAALQRFQKHTNHLHAKLDSLLPAVDSISLGKLYQQSQLGNTAQRLAWMDKKPADFLASDDAFIQLAIHTHAIGLSLEERRKEVDGNLERIIPQYMQALITWKTSLGKPVYPDANSTLRVTYGTVSAYSPKDGITKGPFTTVSGLIEKQTEKAPFVLPANLVDAIREKRFGKFTDPVLGQVPVNFLSSADTTGGNSGSAILNKDGLLIGLNFDSTYESVTKDWYFDNEITRAIHLDIRYMLWIMQEVDHADNLLKEMTIKY